ncbi:hypothetical protein [Paraglaciecola sp.]|uniref:hypothetical protein n=1 Tax=Paraglaciecola sp. TaxID=1920173 RepID=UPI0032658CD7
MDESEIESELLELTPIGADGQSAILNLDKTYGTDSFLFKGPARFEKNEWKTLGINDGMDIGSRGAPFFFSYKLGSHMSEYIILPTVVSATWIFDEEGKLAEIRVIKTVDGL